MRRRSPSQSRDKWLAKWFLLPSPEELDNDPLLPPPPEVPNELEAEPTSSLVTICSRSTSGARTLGAVALHNSSTSFSSVIWRIMFLMPPKTHLPAVSCLDTTGNYYPELTRDDYG
ncbi:hypothetical protein DPEC_G00295350 [Dallia pectoralis]|uniref:Uncharacterized protein n=1 Tax=Dallia pectoralis TaxID=75939 RepID=A0ACC2FIX8_DALPE|nr:hypothetical protein DPEC_G00295350 [Dallia pectoralis]